MSKMKWSLKHDTIFGRELLSWELWKFRSGTRERGNCLEEICKILNNIKDTQFCVSPKGLRDRLKIFRKGLQGQEERGREGLGNFPGISRNRSDHGGLLERRDEEEAKQTKESAEDRNKEDQR